MRGRSTYRLDQNSGENAREKPADAAGEQVRYRRTGKMLRRGEASLIKSQWIRFQADVAMLPEVSPLILETGQSEGSFWFDERLPIIPKMQIGWHFTIERILAQRFRHFRWMAR